MTIQAESPWYIVLTEPQQEITTVWRMHELGLELYTPIVREKRSTQKKDIHGRKIIVMRPKPMFPGYGFVRQRGINDLNAVRAVRGVRDFMRERGRPVLLPHEAVMAVFAKQHLEHQEFMRSKGGRISPWKHGDMVRIDEGVYSGLVAKIDKIDSKGRLQVLLGMIRHTLPGEMVVAA